MSCGAPQGPVVSGGEVKRAAQGASDPVLLSLSWGGECSPGLLSWLLGLFRTKSDRSVGGSSGGGGEKENCDALGIVGCSQCLC